MDTLLSSTDQPESPSGGFALVLGPRQLTAVLVVAVFAAGIFCSLSYIAGRASSRASVASSPPPVRPAATAPKTPLSLVPVPCPAAPAQNPTAPSATEWKNAAPVSGATYLQVMSVEAGAGEIIARGLHDVGLEAIAAPGNGPGVERVLVGPVDEKSIASVRAELEARGLHPFSRKYTENQAPARPAAPDK